MERNRYNTFLKVALLSLWVMVSTVFVGSVTFAGDPMTPNATVVYTKGRLEWDTPVDKQGIADLNLFGQPDEGETLPLIHPLSADTYYLRLQNGRWGKIGYTVFLYIDEPTDIPLTFDITLGEDKFPAQFIPEVLADKQILSSVSGILKSQDMTTLEVNWHWESESDQEDTRLGDLAVVEDQLYTIHSLIVIEDNNPEPVGPPLNPPLAPSNPPEGTPGVYYYHRAYVKGYPDNYFYPDNNITRAEAAAIFARLQASYDESLLVNTESGFRDVDANAWYAKYIVALEELGLVEGYLGGEFRPNDAITRAELTALIMRYYTYSGGEKISGSDISYPDVGLLHWARSYIRKATQAGFVEGYPDGTFRPDRPVTRAEAVAMFNRMLGRDPDVAHIEQYLQQVGGFLDVFDPDFWAYYHIYEAAHDHIPVTGGLVSNP